MIVSRSWSDAKGPRAEIVVDEVKRTSTLTIFNVEPSDAGRVVCQADNGVKGKYSGSNHAMQTSKLVVNRKLLLSACRTLTQQM